MEKSQAFPRLWESTFSGWISIGVIFHRPLFCLVPFRFHSDSLEDAFGAVRVRLIERTLEFDTVRIVEEAIADGVGLVGVADGAVTVGTTGSWLAIRMAERSLRSSTTSIRSRRSESRRPWIFLQVRVWRFAAPGVRLWCKPRFELGVWRAWFEPRSRKGKGKGSGPPRWSHRGDDAPVIVVVTIRRPYAGACRHSRLWARRLPFRYHKIGSEVIPVFHSWMR